MENLDELLQSINDAVWQMHLPTKTFLYVNQRFADLCEISLEKLINNPDAYNELIHPDDRSHVLKEFKKALQGASIETEYRIVTTSGVKWVRHKEMLICDSKNKEEILVGIFSDITDILSAREEVVKSKTNLSALINNTSDLIFSVDTNYRLISANNAFIDRFSSLLGVYLYPGDYILTESAGTNIMMRWKGYFDRCLSGESYSIIEETNIGSLNTVSKISFNTMYDDHGKINGISCFVHDINEHVKNERQIIAQNKRLREIASLASHDIRGHVASILGLLNLMDRKNLENPENYELLNFIEQASRNLDAVIHKIVDTSREVEQQELC